MKENSKKEHSEEAPQENSVNEDAFIALVAEIIVGNVLREYQSKMKKECKNEKECIPKSSISHHLKND